MKCEGIISTTVLVTLGRPRVSRFSYVSKLDYPRPYVSTRLSVSDFQHEVPDLFFSVRDLMTTPKEMVKFYLL